MPEDANQILVKRFDPELPLPEYKTEGAAAFDLYARLETTIAPRTVGYIPLNLAMQIPRGHFAMLCARSSLHKRGLVPANGFGVIDSDYSGDKDEYIAALLNFTDEAVVVPKGERIMQVVVLPVDRFQLVAVDSLSEKSRGGFGSTGNK